MGAIGGILALIGSVLILVGWIMVLISAFKASVLWGIGSLFIWPVMVVFVILNWASAKKGFLIQLAGIGLTIVGAILGAAGGVHSAAQ